MGEAKKRREIVKECLRLAESGTDEEVFARLDAERSSGAGADGLLFSILSGRAENAGRVCLRGTDAGKNAERALRLVGEYLKQHPEHKEGR